jgi:hypothetical protein
VFQNQRGQPFGRMGIARMIERAGEAAKLPFSRSRSHVKAQYGLHARQQRHGHTALAAFPRPRLDHEHGALHCNVAGAVQGYLAQEPAPARTQWKSLAPKAQRFWQIPIISDSVVQK